MACGIPISVAPAPDPTAAFIWDPHDPSQFDTLTFLDVSVDSGGNAFNTATWDFGDGTVLTDPGPRPTHRYGADGDYTVKLRVGTTDGRTAFVTRTVQVRTHDVTINKLTVLGPDQWMAEAKNLGAPYELVREVAQEGKLPVVLFCAGGVATPADAALVMQLGAEGVFVGSGIFKAENPARTAQAIVKATTHFRDAGIIAEVSKGLGEAMSGIEIGAIPERELMAPRGW